jgi:hypothetical protein
VLSVLTQAPGPVRLPRVSLGRGRTVVGFVAESTTAVPVGAAVRYGGTDVGTVREARRVGGRTRLVIALHRAEVPLTTADRLRWQVAATGLEAFVAVAIAPPGAPLLGATDSLADAPTLDWADSARRGVDAFPGLVRDLKSGVTELKAEQQKAQQEKAGPRP